MENISKHDYVIWNKKEKELIENPDIVYHYTTIIEMLNETGFKLDKNQELICVAELPIRLQKVISKAIELTK